MKHKVSDLEGALLDAAVAMAHGQPDDVVREVAKWAGAFDSFAPSSVWGHGGPIIERERIAILPYAHEGEIEYDEAGNNPHLIAPVRWWAAVMAADTGGWIEVCPESEEDGKGEGRTGPTPLIAAMRAYCASRFGEEVELP